MQYIEFDTGRIYDSKQILQITVKEWGTDEWGCGFVTAAFNDQSRRIQGNVTNAPMFSGESIGEAVLNAYDLGNYTAI